MTSPSSRSREKNRMLWNFDQRSKVLRQNKLLKNALKEFIKLIVGSHWIWAGYSGGSPNEALYEINDLVDKYGKENVEKVLLANYDKAMAALMKSKAALERKDK